MSGARKLTVAMMSDAAILSAYRIYARQLLSARSPFEQVVLGEGSGRAANDVIDFTAEIARRRFEAEAEARKEFHVTNAQELANLAERVAGIRLSPNAVCPGHTAPLQAFAEAYFGQYPVSIWKASRGLGGKSTMLALLAYLETVALGAQVTVLGGSGQQSKRIQEATGRFWSHDEAPRQLLKRSTTYETELTNGGASVALMASQTSVRGPHPQRLRLDEVDEIDIELLDAALGQPISARGIESQVVMSSTHQYADGTMTEVIKRAADRGYPVRTWCYRENLETNGGWLSEETKERTRSTVTLATWRVEHELGEPSITSRAIDTESVERMFKLALGEYEGALDRDVIIEEPVPLAEYATGADWARDNDYTVIWTLRTDVYPFRTVAFKRTGRKPYPQMIEDFDERVKRYPGAAAYDATGLGKVIEDLTSVEALNVTLVGKTRSELLSSYVKAIEKSELTCPMITYAYSEHKTATLRDFYGTGHLPDSICAGALALWAYRYGRALKLTMPWGDERPSPWSEDL